MSGFEMRGFDELKKKLKQLGDNAKALDGTHAVQLNDLFPTAFLQRYTEFQSVEDMFEKSGFKVSSPEDFKNIPDAEWDAFIQKHTRFPSWEKMQEKAAAELMSRKLGLK